MFGSLFWPGLTALQKDQAVSQASKKPNSSLLDSPSPLLHQAPWQPRIKAAGALFFPGLIWPHRKKGTSEKLRTREIADQGHVYKELLALTIWLLAGDFPVFHCSGKIFGIFILIRTLKCHWISGTYIWNLNLSFVLTKASIGITWGQSLWHLPHRNLWLWILGFIRVPTSPIRKRSRFPILAFLSDPQA